MMQAGTREGYLYVTAELAGCSIRNKAGAKSVSKGTRRCVVGAAKDATSRSDARSSAQSDQRGSSSLSSPSSSVAKPGWTEPSTAGCDT